MKVIVTVLSAYDSSGMAFRSALAEATGISENEIAVCCPKTAIAENRAVVSFVVEKTLTPIDRGRLIDATEKFWKKNNCEVDVRFV